MNRLLALDSTTCVERPCRPFDTSAFARPSGFANYKLSAFANYSRPLLLAPRQAFPIWGISDPARATLLEDIERSKKEALDYASRLRGSSGLRGLEGTVAIHNDTSLLVATGPESFVDIVESIVTAFLAKERARNPEFRTALPTAPAK